MDIKTQQQPSPFPPASQLAASSSTALLQQPALAWGLVLVLLGGTTLGCFAGAGSILRLAFPVGATAVAIFLYFFQPIFYVQFNWWIWCFTPFLRRVGDYYRGSFDESSLMLTAPYLVTLVSLLTLFRYLPRTHKTGDLPFIFAIGAVFFSFLVGGLLNPATTVARTFLDWMPPVLFGLHLSTEWRRYPDLRRTTQTTFIWIVLLAGAYGIYQYMVAPAWDCYWLEAVDNVSFGLPEPQKIRVWSTMNSPPPFGCIMMGALLILFSSRKPLTVPAAGAGYLALLLSLVRAAWAGWVFGLLAMVTSLKPKLQMRLVLTILIMMLCVVPLTQISPFSDVLTSRFETFTNIQDDSSYEARAETYSRNLDVSLSDPLGKGLGSTWLVKPNGQIERIALDSGFLDTFFTLGWLGGIPYLAAIFLLLGKLFRGEEGQFDAFANAVRSVAFSFLAILLLGPFNTGLPGMMLWGCLGLGMAAHKYHTIQAPVR